MRTKQKKIIYKNIQKVRQMKKRRKKMEESKKEQLKFLGISEWMINLSEILNQKQGEDKEEK